ncbi:MAG: DUF1588 domain-containing protein [Myxococcales bacterium]|nr:DUF1588 domain-containing protein [Myxococcales bacterium]
MSMGLAACEGTGKCVSNDEFFRTKATVFMDTCVSCHNSQGAAKATKFVLERSANPGYVDANLRVLSDLARYEVEGQGKLLLIKPTQDGVSHEGGTLFDKKSDQYKQIEEMIERLENPVECENSVDLGEYFGDVQLLDEEETLRKASLALVGRLPTQDEYEQVRGLGIDSLDPVLDAMMEEDPFYTRLGEWYNDLFLTDRYVGGTAAIDLLYDEDFPTRRWFDGQADQLASWSNIGVARSGVNLVKYVVRNNRPFTEVLTADYMVFTPYSAKSFGLDIGRVTGIDGGALNFADATDPDELQAGKMKLADGTPYPHAGIISDTIWNIRFPTTDTNRNRHRSRMIYRFFLATDILRLAERPIDPTSIADHNPTMNNPNCAVCHENIDPIAGAMMNFDAMGRYAPPEEGWYPDMRVPGYKDQTVPFDQFQTAHVWLAQQIAAEPLFGVATVQTVFTGLTGQEVMYEPNDPEDPDYLGKHKAFEIQDMMIKDVAAAFDESGYDFKLVVRELVKSEFFRAKNAREAIPDDKAASYSAIGTAQFLPPEQLSRKIEAVTGYPWRQNPTSTDYLLSGNEYRIFYGGIDSDSITERIREPNGIMANIAARMSNEMSCWVTARDFSQLPPDRLLFPFVEPTSLPEDDNGNAIPAVIDSIKANIQYLHHHVLGERLELDDPQIDRTYALWIDIWKDGKLGVADMTYGESLGACGAQNDWWTGNPLPEERRVTSDPDYTIRAWMGVMSYLLSDYRFLHE